MKTYTDLEKINVIKDYLENSSVFCLPLVSLLTLLCESESVVLRDSDVDILTGFIRPNGSLGTPSVIMNNKLFDTTYNMISLRPINVQYDGQGAWNTIAGALNLQSGETLAQRMGYPLNLACRRTMSTTLADAISSEYDFGTHTTECDIELNLDTTSYVVGHVVVASDADKIAVLTRDDDADSTALTNGLAGVAEVTEYKELLLSACRAASLGINTNANGIISAVNSYLSSKFASVRKLARELRDDGLVAISRVISDLYAKFRNQFDWTVDDAGNVVWGEQAINQPESNPFAFVVSGLGSVASTIGSVLLFSSNMIAKVIGLVAIIGGAAVTALNSAISQTAGTTPTINSKAGEPTYGDYVLYKHIQAPLSGPHSHFFFDTLLKTPLRSMPKLQWLLSSDAYNSLASNGNITVTTAYWVIYIYNYQITDGVEDYYIKIFPTCGTRGSKTNLGDGKEYTNCFLNYILPEYKFVGCTTDMNFTSWALTSGHISAPCWFHGSDYGYIGLDKVLESVNNQNRLAGVTAPGDLVDVGMSYETWNTAAGSVMNSLYIISEICSSCRAMDAIDGDDYVLPGEYYTGEQFDASIPNLIQDLRTALNFNSIVLLLMLSKDVTNFDPSTTLQLQADYYHYEGSTKVWRTSNDYSVSNLPQFEASVYSQPMENIAPAMIGPARSLFAIVAAAAIVAAITVTIVLAAKFAMKHFSRIRAANRRAVAKSLSQEATQRFNKTDAELKAMTPEARSQYLSDWKKFVRKVSIFNFLGTLFGNTTYDYRNDWVNVPDASGDTTGAIANLGEAINVLTNEPDSSATELSGGLPRSRSDIDVKNLTLADVYAVITGDFSSDTINPD